jgi:hypothetical protein
MVAVSSNGRVTSTFNVLVATIVDLGTSLLGSGDFSLYSRWWEREAKFIACYNGLSIEPLKSDP